ncbi:MAG TPA: hypothetical protein VFZ65_14610, partial [Planctomycetota bacterium]|nr:hypothetical protein [Planctomycetota bacterium]
MPKQKGLPLRAFAIFLLAAFVGIAGGLLGNLFQEGLLHIQDLLTGVVRTEDYRPSLSQAVREHLSW